MLFMRKTTTLPNATEALPGRAEPIPTATRHFVNGNPLKPPYPAGLEQAVFGLGCFWGAERKFWELGDGIYVTAAGYAGGHTENPTYEEVCSGRTGHTEVVLVVFDPAKISYERLLKTFWESHNPPKASVPSRPRSLPQVRFILPRTITSNISPRIRPAIADWVGPACRARFRPASPPDQKKKRFVNHNWCKTETVSYVGRLSCGSRARFYCRSRLPWPR